MFELEKLRQESGLSGPELEQLEKEVIREFPKDKMMFELHLVRILQALQNGWISKEQLFPAPQKIAA